MAYSRFLYFLIINFILFSCADDQPFLQGHIKRASDAIMIPCDPYNTQKLHTCVVFASAFLQKLVIYDATADEMTLSPLGYVPLLRKVGTSTNYLARVVSPNLRFPYFLALDQGQPALYVTRAFPRDDNKEPSFTSTEAQSLGFSEKPYRLAAWQGESHVFVLVTYRDDKQLGLFALDPESGLLDPVIKPVKIPLGEKPSHIQIDMERQFALISDEAQAVIHKLDLSSIKNIFSSQAATVSPLKLGMTSDKIYLQKRDFGFGSRNYLVATNNTHKELRLIDVNNNKIELVLDLKEYPQAVYFPDAQSEPCCDANKNWLAVADIKSQLFYYIIKKNNNNLHVEEAAKQPIDLLSEKYLALSQLQLSTIIGGHIETDPSLDRPQICAGNRKMFFITSFAAERPLHWSVTLPVEVEAQAYSCEGAQTANRFGRKHE